MRPLIFAGTVPHRDGDVNGNATMAATRWPAYVAGMAQSSHERDEAQRREALESLRSLSESDTFATSALARTAQRASDHFSARDAAGEDRVELWGRRIGRALSLVGFIALAIYLYLTHFR